jgi:flagellar protein FlaG
MDFNIPPIGGGVERTGPAARNAPAPKADFSEALDTAVNVSTLPASPPPAVLEDMHVAARVAEELRAQGRELHFETTGNGRVIVQVRDLDGNVIRTIPPAGALEVASGQPLEAA